MGNEPVFLDTSCLIALARKRDMWHAAATTVMRRLGAQRRPLVTSQWVLSEFLGGAAAPPLRTTAVAVVRQLATSPSASILPATPDGFDRVVDFYASRPDKEWSFVDCSTILFCQERGIRSVFASDHHFEQAGLEILLADRTDAE